MQQKVHVKAENARTFVEGVLKGNGVSAENAVIIADCLVKGESNFETWEINPSSPEVPLNSSVIAIDMPRK